MRTKGALLAVALAAGPAGAGMAATYQISLAGQTTTFTAEAAGGPISGLVVGLGDVVFDTALGGSGTPTYDPVDNDINGDGSLFGYLTNSVAAAPCAPGDCLLEFEDAEADAPPKLWAAFSAPGGVFGEFLGSGEYEIVPAGGGSPDGVVPLPAAGGLLLLGLGLLGAGRARRRAG